MKTLIIETDGGARGNPGPAGIGIVFRDASQRVIAKYNKFLGIRTNNQAEYEAVLAALLIAKEKYKAFEIHFYIDSQLIVEQLYGRYKIKNENLKPLHFEIQKEKLNFKQVLFDYIPRHQNKLADRLVNFAINQRLKK